MGLPVLYYEGRDNPPHPEIWIDYFVKVFSLYSEKVLKIATSSVNDNEKQRFNQLSIKAKNLLNYLKDEQILEFSPIELAPIFNVSKGDLSIILNNPPIPPVTILAKEF